MAFDKNKGMRILYIEENESKSVLFDATLKEVPTYSATPTRHPVVRGVSIVDHVDIAPVTVAFEVQVSNTPIVSPDVDSAVGSNGPLSLAASLRTLRKGASVSSSGSVDPAEYDARKIDPSALVLQFSNTFDRVLSVYDKLIQFRDNATLLSVVTRMRTWDNMVIANLEAPRDPKVGEAINFAIDFEQIQIADLQVIAQPDALEPRGARTRQRGPANTTSASAAQEGFLRAALRGAAFGSLPSVFGG